MKIKFSCNMCGESFNVSSENLIKKDSVICPNCSAKFPESSFPQLKEGIKQICECRESLPLENVKMGYCHLMNFEIVD